MLKVKYPVSINGVADMLISCNVDMEGSFIETGVISKYVQVYSTFENSIFHLSDCVENYNISVPIVNGYGEVVISTLPSEAKLHISEVSLEGIYKDLSCYYTTADLSDVNWDRGIGNFASVLLLNYTEEKNQKLQNATKIIDSNGKEYNIASVENVGSTWIHVYLNNNVEDMDLSELTFPNMFMIE